MSLNRFMHPRNIYRTKPNFAQMAANYPSFGAIVRLDLSGKVTIDYNDCNALRQLTKTLLKKDFDLEVDIPLDRLIPTVPMRLNYILWIEDLIVKLTQFLQIDDKDIIGLDVGTGSCAIFPLITSTLHKSWRFVATDIDKFNIECAQKNVINNGLSDRIKVIESKDEEIFDSAIDLVKPQTIHYSMTNPPFFSDNFNDSDNNCEEMKSDFGVNDSSNELKTKSKHYSRKKSLANTSIVTEAICDGGEVEFVRKMIDESLQIRDKIMIYSSMLGKKRSLLELKNIIEQYVEKGLITSFVSTEFCQGLTKRWGIAWTFINGLNLKEVQTIKSVKSKPPLIYFLPPIMKETKYDMQSISQKIRSLLINDLKIDSFEIKENRKSIEFIIKANENTWSHQRKRRREAKLKLKHDSEYNSDIKSSDSQINETPEHKMDYSCDSDVTNESNSDKIQTFKRSLEEDINEDIKSIDLETKKPKTCKEYGFNELYLLHCSLLIKRDKQSIYIQLETKELAQSHESTYQLFQYFKNNLI